MTDVGARAWSWLRRPLAPLREDLAADPYLRYLLALSTLICGFGIWFRVPNFAAPDEYSRLVDPMKAAGRFAADPGLESLRRGVTDGRALGATFYLYGLVLVPVFLAVVATGQLGEFVALGAIESRWELWHAAPAWFWTSTVLLGRLVSVLFGVGCVYLTYRLGTTLGDRFAGRVAALLLALSVGFFSQTHLVGEDAPMLFFLLATLVFAARYVRSGRTADFLLGCLTGGLATVFKLSGGVAVVVLGVALFDRARRSDSPLDELLRPRVVLGGLAVGIVTITVGIPSVLFGGPGELLGRAAGSISTKTGKSGGLDASIWYWFLQQYATGFGWPLTVAAAAGLVATVRGLLADPRRRSEPLFPLLFVTVAVYVLVYSRWEFVRLRHVVPTFPVLLVLLGVEVSRRRTDSSGTGAPGGWRAVGRDLPRLLRVGMAVLLVTTALFAGAAQSQYLTDPRDEATRWLEANTDPGERVEVYENSVADVATPHGRETSHFEFQEERATNTPSLILDQQAFTEWMVSMPDREPAYVQLTAAELAYLDPLDPASSQYPERRAYVRGLLAGEYEYRVAAEFGTRPQHRTLASRLLYAGLVPEVDGREQWVLLLEREG
jgi:hypothetical protein